MITRGSGEIDWYSYDLPSKLDDPWGDSTVDQCEHIGGADDPNVLNSAEHKQVAVTGNDK